MLGLKGISKVIARDLYGWQGEKWGEKGERRNIPHATSLVGII